MTLYEFLKLIHVLGAITWVGTSIEQQVVGARAMSSSERGRLAHFVDEAEWVGVRIMTPAAILVVIVGVLMVIESGWNFSDTWILIGIGLFILTSLNGMVFLTPQTKKLKSLIVERSENDKGVQALVKRVTLASRIDLLILIAIVSDMVIKPGL
jgi:uncharacterized membrane protein